MRVLTGGRRGRLVLRRAVDFRAQERFEPQREAICAATLSACGRHVFAGLQTGQCVVFAVDLEMADPVELL